MTLYKYLFFLSFCLPAAVWAAHPLITDDAGTQGKGNFQLEVNGQYDHDKEDETTATGGQAVAALTYGITDKIDLALGMPYVWVQEEHDQSSSREHGFADATLDVKMRFWEKDGLSFAVKPGLSLPTGDDDKGLGAGKVGYHFYLIGMKEAGSWTFLANLGYIRNETDLDNCEKDIWHVSLAAMYALDEHWKIVADAVSGRNTDTDGDKDPVSGILGVIYSPAKNIDLDLGVKAGLTDSATDWSLLAGTTVRF